MIALTGFARAFAFVREREGGTVNDPNDHGGLTKWGVTQATYDAWRTARLLPRRAVTALTESECRAIYWGYWVDASCDLIAATGKEDTALAVFDCAINSGAGTAKKLLQRALAVEEDGVLGPRTRAQLAASLDHDLERIYLDVRAEHYRAIAAHNPTQRGFLNGWMARLRWLAKATGVAIGARFARTKANGAPTAAVVVLLLGSAVLPRAARAQSGQPTARPAPAAPSTAVLPDPTRTPGAILTTDADDVCTPGWAGRHRDVSVATKRAVYNAYRITTRAPGEYEIDHLISLQLGGSNDVTNLWPERYAMPKGAYAKDSVENWLHREVCDGRMTLRAAQSVIARDWTEAHTLMHLDLARRALTGTPTGATTDRRHLR